jgi:anti-sigma factor RsiW
VAKDPGLADQVATLARLKATVHEQGQAPLPAELAEVYGTATRRQDAFRRPRRRTWAMFGATAAALAIALIVAAVMLPMGSETARPAWRDLAVRLHQSWAGSDPAQTAAPTADSLLASLSQLGQAAQVPDLSGARLTVAYLRPISSDYGRGLHVGYRGTRGCRVSLFILPATGGLSGEPVALAGEGSQQFAWRVGALGYALLASGMDPRHYAVVLDTVYQASRTMAPVGPETRTALTRSRSRSQPCAA